MMAAQRFLFGDYRVDEVPLSRGGVGSIHRTDDPAFVFKRYFNPSKAPSRDDLDRLVHVGREVLILQDKKPGETPESSVNWPVDLAIDNTGAISGVILPAIPQKLFNPEHGNVRTLDFLILPRAKPPSARGRIVLLLRMAEILAFVNARKLVHGDINGKNLAWAAFGVPEPIMYLIDCDGMVSQDPPPAHGVGASGWMDPRVIDHLIPAHDHYSDWYALSLAMYRGLLLTPGNLGKDEAGRWQAPKSIPTSLPEPVARLIKRGLTSPLEVSSRPTPDEWVEAMVATFLPGGRFDDEAIAAVDAASTKPVPAKQRERDFVRLPQSDWVSQPTATAVVPPGPRHWTGPAPTPQPPPPPPPVWQQQPIKPPQPMPFPPVVQYQPMPVRRGPTGSLAWRAIDGGAGWYVIGTLASLLLPAIAIVYIAIALFQLRHADSEMHGVTRARVSLYVFGGICLFTILPLVISAIV